jgi:NADH:ubiquinone reductase (H+-translocating)
VELAGTIAELAHEDLREDFRHIDTRRARIILIEAGPRILPNFTEDLSTYAHAALERLGVEIELGSAVRECTDDGVVFGDRKLSAKVILWAAGVRASPAADWLGVPADHANRIKVEPDLSTPGYPEIFVIGDTATIDGWHGEPVPGIAPAAKQQGRHVATTITASRRRFTAAVSLQAFRQFRDHRQALVIDFGWIRIRGWIAWWIWRLLE